MAVKIEVEGIDDALNSIKAGNKKTVIGITNGITKATFYVQGEVKASIAGQRVEPTSVDTGRFLNSVDVDVGKDSGIVFTDIEYSKYLEYGTSVIKPRRHFEHTKFRTEEKVKEILDDSIKE